ncbi:MAG TPA: signal peptide peptidase SppA [Caulobacteraceae bacterium]|nr:signal peptide peptidase SppA [Caulobacteraceae bacterium]
MKQFLTTVAGVFVGLLLFAFVMPFFLIGLIASASRPAPTPANTVLSLDLRAGMTDQQPQAPFPGLSGKTLSVIGIEETLRRAEQDPKVKGLFVRLPEGGMAPAAADELRLAFKRFRAAGKPILVHSQGVYPSGVVTATYELAAASGDVWMQPASSFQVTGLASTDIFFKRFFDKYGVTPDYQQRYEYKNAVNPYLYSDYTAAHRESEVGWLGSVYATGLANAAADRGRNAADLKTLIEGGPWSAEEARARGLIDRVGEEKDAETAILKQAGDGARMMDFADYAAKARQAPAIGAGLPTVAVINAEGAIVTGTSEHASPFGSGQTIYSDDIAKAFYTAIEDKEVKAIVFRVSSPGGSDTASEQILAAVRAAKAAGKPVVVSMGTYAASGGYWISSQASEIVAQPSTLTGSIGVFGGKFAVGDALSRFGVDVRGLSVGGPYAAAFGPGAPMTNAQKAAFGAWMDRIYDGFVGRVAEGRKIPADRVREIAKGRVWTGVQAKALGLVDQIGGFYQAVDRAKALSGITGQARLKTISVQVSPFEALSRLFGAGTEATRILASLDAMARAPEARAIGGEVRDASLRAQGATVLAPRLVD